MNPSQLALKLATRKAVVIHRSGNLVVIYKKFLTQLTSDLLLQTEQASSRANGYKANLETGTTLLIYVKFGIAGFFWCDNMSKSQFTAHLAISARSERDISVLKISVITRAKVELI
ncbi:hypothetical protein EAG18_08650 [Pseudoalteromonas sp. J010]|nr:hypothetical protein EAG18_08650 [Pseudoalteromonas sp. J010]